MNLRSEAVSLGCARLFLAMTMMVALSGCHIFFNNDEQIQEPLQFKEQNLSCVRSVGSDVAAFFDGGDQDLVQVIDCVSGALVKFAANTRGAKREGWTRGELSAFFETYFREEVNREKAAAIEFHASREASKEISKIDADPEAKIETVVEDETVEPYDGDWIAQARRRAVIDELFRWKSTLIGGGDQLLTRSELENLRLFLLKLRGPLAPLRGHGALLSFNRKSKSTEFPAAKVEDIVASVRSLAEVVALELESEVESKSRPREPMKLKTLAISLEQAGIKALEPAKRKELVQVAKIFAVAGDPDVIAGNEWPVLIRRASEIWVAAFRIQKSILQNPNAFDSDLAKVELTVGDVLALGRSIVDRHDGRISNTQIRRLVDSLQANDLLPALIRAESLGLALEAIFGKLLAGNSNPRQKELSQGLHIAHIERLAEIFTDWLEGQKIANELTGHAGFVSITQSRVSISSLQTKSPGEVAEAARTQMADLILTGRPMVHDLLDRMMIVPTEQIPGYRRRDLEKLNVSRVIANVGMRGYAHAIERAGAMPTMTESEAQELFLDLKGIGKDAGLVDIRSLHSGARTFMEGNVFLSVSDGNAFLSLHETVEWFSTCMAAGQAADRLHEDLLPLCGTAPLDVYGKQRIDAKCFRENAVPALRQRMSHLPNVLRAIDNADRLKMVPQFLRALERASRAMGDSDIPIESSEMRVLSPILHYTESLFARHDSNHSGLMDQPEVWGIFPLIQPFIRKVASEINLSSGEERAIFSWMLVKGEAPKTTTSGKLKLKYHQAKMAVDLVEEQATIQDIVSILASFSQVGRESKDAQVRNYYLANAVQWEAGIARGDQAAFLKTRELFQCANEADTDLIRLWRARRSELFAVGSRLKPEEQAQVFLARAKNAIQTDPRLQLLCMAF